MLVAQDKNHVTSTVPAENRVAMGVKRENMPHVMGLLYRLYSDRFMAVLREYSTNAYDAQIEAGVECPIQVTLPEESAYLADPVLKIRDHGTGLDHESIVEVYSSYGASTKRGSNDFNGQLGIGSKSAFSYAAQFTVTSVKAGTKIVVMVTRDADGGGSMTVVDTFPTDEPNGTEVTVPIQRADIHRFWECARDLFQYWTKGTVLVNGKAPAHFTERMNAREIAPGFYATQSGMSQIVMGNVAYPAPGLNNVLPRGNVIAFVPIGSVQFVESREHLRDDKATQAAVERIADKLRAALKGAVQKDIDGASTPQDAVARFVAWSGMLSNAHPGSYTYKGEALPTGLRHPDAAGGRFHIAYARDSYKGNLGFAARLNLVHISDIPETVWVEGFFPQKYNASHKKKMLKAVEEWKVRPTQFACLDGKVPRNDPAFKYVPAGRILQWEDLRKIKVDERQRGGGRISGSFDIITEEDDYVVREVTGDRLREDVPLMWFHGRANSGLRIVQRIRRLFPKFTLVFLGANRIDKFKRETGAQSAMDVIRAEFEKWAKTVPADVRLALAVQRQRHALSLKDLDESRIKDPEVKQAIQLAKRNVNTEEVKLSTFEEVLDVDGFLPTDVPQPLNAARYPLAFDRYGVVTQGGRRGQVGPHLYDYLNWHYETNLPQPLASV